MHAGEIDLGAERGAGQHGELVRGVDAVDVEAGIGLGIARRLRLGQHGVEVAAGLAHRGQDVVAGAVEDAVEAPHAIADQAFAQCLDDRDAARDRRLERRGCGPSSRPAVASSVPCMASSALLAVTTCLPERSAVCTRRRATPLEPPMSSTTTSMSGAVASAMRIALPAHARDVDVTLAGFAPCADGNDLERPPAAQRQEPAVLGQKFDDACANGAEAGDADSERSFHGPPDTTGFAQARAFNGVMLSPTPRR